LGVLGVAGSSHLLGGSLSETNTEKSEEVAINGLGLHEGFDEGVPLLDEGAELVLGNVHTVEVSEAIVALNFFNLDLDLSPGLSTAVSVQISQRYFEYSALQTVSGVLLSSSLVAGGDGWDSHIEDCGYVHIVPLLS